MSKVLVNLSKDIKEFCAPHFEQLGLDHFNYIHKNYEGNVTYLCSNPEWIKHYINQSYPRIGAFENNAELSSFKYILWNGLEKDDPILLDSKEMLGVEFGITIIKHEKDGFGFYNLGKKSSNSSIINEYVNNIDKYENFILSFQEESCSVLEEAKKIKLNIHDFDSASEKNKKNGYSLGNLYLTEREVECINYLTLGKTAEETSIILNISKRTVESHILNIKRKMNCFNQFRLGYLVGRIGIL